jgi:hypothetical protein
MLDCWLFSSTVSWRTHTFKCRYLLHSLPFQWDSTAYIENKPDNAAQSWLKARGGTGSNKKRISVEIKIMILFCRRERLFEEIFIRLMGLSTQRHCIASMTLSNGYWGELQSSAGTERRGRASSTLALCSRSPEFMFRLRDRIFWGFLLLSQFLKQFVDRRKIAVFWNVCSRSLVKGHWCFQGKRCFHLQCSKRQ